MTSGSEAREATTGHQVAGVLLTFTSGAVDVTCFLALGKVFASVMTGNMVLLGLAAGTSNATLALASGLAFLGYVSGTTAGALITARSRGMLKAIVVELCLIIVFTAVWEALDARPGVIAKHALVFVVSAAMGLQSAAVISLGVPNFSTTYMTSTLTRVFMQLTAKARSGGHIDAWALGRLLALIAGVALTALLLLDAPRFAPALPLAALSLALALSARAT